MAIYLDEDDVYKALADKLGHEPAPWIWEFVCEQRFTLDVVNEDNESDQKEAFEALLSQVKSLIRLAPRGPQSRSLKKRECAPSARTEVIPFILAAEAAYSPAVRQFRRETLRSDDLLSPDQASAWIDRQIQEQGDPTLHLHRAQSPSGRPLPLGSIARDPKPQFFGQPWNPGVGKFIPKNVLAAIESGDSLFFPNGSKNIAEIASLDVSHKDPRAAGSAWSLRTETLSIRGYPDLPVRISSPLGALKRVALHLERSLGLLAPDWARFVITGIPPEPLLASARVATGPCPALDTIELRVAPSTDPRDITRLFQKSKQRLLAREREILGSSFSFGHQIEDRFIRLAGFAAQQNNGRTWDETRLAWNQLYPNCKYGPEDHFSRDARDSHKRITGKRLRWKRRRGRGSLPPRE